MGEYLALPDGAGSFPQGFSDPVVLRDIAQISCLTRTGLSPSMARLSRPLQLRRVTLCASPTTPMQPRPHRFRLFPVRSPLLRESLLLSLPPGTEMFQFPGFASQSLCIQLRDDISSRCRVAPFGNPRITAYLQLPVAYRSLSRPSSPVHAKASAIHPYLLKPSSFLHKSGLLTLVLSMQHTSRMTPEGILHAACCACYLAESICQRTAALDRSDAS